MRTLATGTSSLPVQCHPLPPPPHLCFSPHPPSVNPPHRHPPSQPEYKRHNYKILRAEQSRCQ